MQETVSGSFHLAVVLFPCFRCCADFGGFSVGRSGETWACNGYKSAANVKKRLTADL